MALLKSITKNNVTANYWKISIFSFFSHVHNGVIILYGYENEQARINGNSRIMATKFEYDSTIYDMWFSPTELDKQGSNPLKNAYLYVKSIPNGEFSDAIDI